VRKVVGSGGAVSSIATIGSKGKVASSPTAVRVEVTIPQLWRLCLMKGREMLCFKD
jgi:hypothetical protein